MEEFDSLVNDFSPGTVSLVATFLDDSHFAACLFAASDMPVLVEFNESPLHPNKTRKKFDELGERFGRKIAFVRLNMNECNVLRMYRLKVEELPIYQIFLDRRPIEGERCKDDPLNVEILVRRWLEGGAGRALHVDGVTSFIGQLQKQREHKKYLEAQKQKQIQAAAAEEEQKKEGQQQLQKKKKK